MVSPVIAQAILGQQAPDIAGNFFKGQEESRVRQARDLQGQALQKQLGTGELGQLAAKDPNAALQLSKALGIPINEEGRLKSFAKDIQIAVGLSATDPEGAIKFALQRRNKLNDLGIETPVINSFLEKISFDRESAFDDLDIIHQGLIAGGVLDDGAGGDLKTFAPVTLINPVTKEKVLVAPTRGKDGKLSLKPFAGIEGFEVSRETAEEKRAADVLATGQKEQAKADVKLGTVGTIEGSKEAAKQAIQTSGKAFERLGKINESIPNIDEAIALIDEGANTGVIFSKLPSIRQASIALDNLQGRLGLDVIGNTTFGALSESELKFALDTALPKNLQGEALKSWLRRKKDAQVKLANHLSNVASFLGTPGNTVADFIEMQKVQQLESEQPAPGPAQGAQPTGQRFIFNPETSRLEPQ